MSVKVRLSRVGGKKAPFYRIVVCDSRSPRDGRFIEHIGVYDPTREPVEVRLDNDRYDHWVKVGAEPSVTVGEIVRRHRRAEAEAAKSTTPAVAR
jgi:small subunit ribosomal protein S16